MRFIVRTGPGQLEINYMWLPTFIGMNSSLVRELDSTLSTLYVGKVLTSELMDAASRRVIEIITDKFPSLRGLYDYLDGIKYVEEDGAQD